MPYLNDQWFNPAISWQNKYNSHLPFATTLTVFTTDAYHFNRFMNKAFVIGAVFTFKKPKKWKEGIKKGVMMVVCYSVGKGLVHQIFR